MPTSATAGSDGETRRAADGRAKGGTHVSGATPLKLSYSAQIAANLPVWVGADSDIGRKYGLDIQFQYIASSNGIPAVLSGDIQMANVGGSETLNAIVHGGDLVMIGMTLPVYPFVMMAPAEIGSDDQLRGKKIGVSNIGSTSDTATRVLLRQVGARPGEKGPVSSVHPSAAHACGSSQEKHLSAGAPASCQARPASLSK